MLLGTTPAFVSGQGEMLILKKHGKVQKTFFKGSQLIFDLGNGMQSANLYQLKNDSLFLAQYDIRMVMGSLAIPVQDTVATYRSQISYKDIIAIGKEHTGWNWNATGISLFSGGALLTTAGLVSWIVAQKNTRYYARPGLVGGAAAFTGIGFLLMKSTGDKKMTIGKKYTLEYISPN